MSQFARENSCSPELSRSGDESVAMRHKRSSSLGSSEHVQVNFVKLYERYQSHESSFWDLPVSPESDSDGVLSMLEDLSIKSVERRDSLLKKLEGRLTSPTSLQTKRRRRLSSPISSAKVAKSKLCE